MTVKTWIQAGLAAVAPGRAVLKWFVAQRKQREKVAANKLLREKARRVLDEVYLSARVREEVRHEK